MRRLVVLFVALSVFASGCFSLTQIQTYSVAGMIVDEVGDPIPGLPIVVASVQTTTDENGTFEVDGLSDDVVEIAPAGVGGASFGPVKIVAGASPAFVKIVANRPISTDESASTPPSENVLGPSVFDVTVLIPRSLPRPDTTNAAALIRSIVGDDVLISVSSGPEGDYWRYFLQLSRPLTDDEIDQIQAELEELAKSYAPPTIVGGV